MSISQPSCASRLATISTAYCFGSLGVWSCVEAVVEDHDRAGLDFCVASHAPFVCSVGVKDFERVTECINRCAKGWTSWKSPSSRSWMRTRKATLRSATSLIQTAGVARHINGEVLRHRDDQEHPESSWRSRTTAPRNRSPTTWNTTSRGAALAARRTKSPRAGTFLQQSRLRHQRRGRQLRRHRNHPRTRNRNARSLQPLEFRKSRPSSVTKSGNSNACSLPRDDSPEPTPLARPTKQRKKFH